MIYILKHVVPLPALSRSSRAFCFSQITKLSLILSASIKVHTSCARAAAVSRSTCGRDGKNIIARINHGRTSGGVRMYLGLSGLDYTSSRWVLVGFPPILQRRYVWEFLVNAPRLFAFDTGERVESRFNRRRHSDRHGVNLMRYAPPSTSSCFYCALPLAHCSR